MKTIVAVGKPTVLVLLNGSALAIGWARDHVPAIVEAWYPGQAGGAALADVLFGDYNPAGRLPVTFYDSANQLPPFTDYSMKNRTYRFFHGEPLFPFGFGLSYTSFAYHNLQLPNMERVGADTEISVEVENTGTKAGEEVVELYVNRIRAAAADPIRSLAAFQRMALNPGERKTAHFKLTAGQFATFDTPGRRIVEPGMYEISIGGKQPGFNGAADATTTGVLIGRVQLDGAPQPLN